MVAYLTRQGHAVEHVCDVEGAEAALATGGYACILLDLGLPDGSGLGLLQRLRRRSNRTPVLITTALDQISDRIAGLDAGADDYVVKPYDLHELAARIRAHARRGQGLPEARLAMGDLQVDRAAARVWRDGTELRLTSRERVLSKSALEEALYAFDTQIEGNAVEVYISRLRGKIGAERIVTRRGLGYLVP